MNIEDMQELLDMGNMERDLIFHARNTKPNPKKEVELKEAILRLRIGNCPVCGKKEI